MHFPNSQKELTVSLRISEFWMGKKKKKPQTQKTPPTPQILMTFFTIRKTIFSIPVFTNPFLLSLSEILYSVIFVMTSLSHGSLYASMQILLLLTVMT